MSSITSRSPEEFSPFARVYRLRFDHDRRCRLDGRLPESLGASPYFLRCREHLNGAGGVLTIVEVDEKYFLQIAALDEGRSGTWPIDVPTIQPESIAEAPRCSSRFRSA
jgi:hypothetical protein